MSPRKTLGTVPSSFEAKNSDTLDSRHESEFALLLGRSGGQSLIGDTASNDDLTLEGTSDGTRTSSYIILQPTAGNVGIGSTAPTSLLEISDTDASPVLTITNKSDTEYDPSIQLRVGVTPATKFTLGVDDSDSDKFKISTTALGTGDRLIIDSSGNITLNGATTVAGNLIPSGNDSSSLGDDTHRWSDIYLGAETIHLGTVNTDEVKISYVSATDTTSFQPTTDSVTAFQFQDANGGTPILNIDSDNERVGIGTATPSALLQLAAGSASQAPLIISSGSALTSLTSGAIENDGTYFYYTDSTSKRRILNTGTLVHDPSGFPNTTDTTLSFSNALDPAPTFTITGTNFLVYKDGQQFTKNTQSIDITDTEGLWFFYYDADGVLTASQTAWNLSTSVCIAYIYWDATNNTAITFGDERHGITMDWQTHQYLHLTVGTRYNTGLTLTGDTTGSGASDAHAEVAVSNGSIYDEDLIHTITDGSPQDLTPIAQIPVYYRSGAAANNWRKDTATNFPVKQGSARIAYNLNTAGTWTTPDVTQGDYVSMWVFATNDVVNPVIAMLGQRVDTTLTNAMNNSTYESMTFGTLPYQEMKVIYRLIFQTSTTYGNTPHARLRNITDYRSVSNLPAGTYVATDHGVLTGLLDDDHTQYALLAGRSSGQTLIGGEAANETITLQGNAAAAGNTLTNTNIQFKVGDSGVTTAMTILNNVKYPVFRHFVLKFVN
jgi:hypothetical protein